MAISIKVIASNQLNSIVATDLFTPVLNGKTQIIKSIRFANPSASAAVTLNVYFARSTGPNRQIAPKNLIIPAGNIYVDESEITLEAGDRIRASVSGGVVDYIISGIERDV